MEEGHDVELATAILKNPHGHEIYRRDVLDGVRVVFVVRGVVAMDSSLAMTVLRTLGALRICGSQPFSSPTLRSQAAKPASSAVTGPSPQY